MTVGSYKKGISMAENTENKAAVVQSDQKKTGKAKMKKPAFPAVEEIFVDGIAGIMGRGGVFKLDCYRVDGVEDDGKTELRRISHRLVLPAASINELIQVVQGVVKSAAKAKENFEKQKKTIN
jgi:hypothetical protein